MESLEEYSKELIEPEQKFIASFYEKFDAITNLYDSNAPFSGDLKCVGKYNSKISLVFKTKEHLKSLMPNLEKIFNLFGIKIYNTLIFFYDKYSNDDENIKLIYNELSILNPRVIYYFDFEALNETIKGLAAENNTLMNTKTFTIMNLEKFLCITASPDIFDCFKYLINYNY